MQKNRARCVTEKKHTPGKARNVFGRETFRLQNPSLEKRCPDFKVGRDRWKKKSKESPTKMQFKIAPTQNYWEVCDFFFYPVNFLKIYITNPVCKDFKATCVYLQNFPPVIQMLCTVIHYRALI